MIKITDTAIVAALLSLGFNYSKLDTTSNKFSFEFEESKSIDSTIQLYQSGSLMVNALVFNTQFKSLITKIKEIKNESNQSMG